MARRRSNAAEVLRVLFYAICLVPMLVASNDSFFSPYPFEFNEYKRVVVDSNDRNNFVQNLTESLSNQHLVMIGDSIMRQQYLSLVYLLRNKTYSVGDYNPDNPNGLYDHYVRTNEDLKPYEFCDCYRSIGVNFDTYCENRYYADPIHNISVTYLQFFGKDLFGHWFDSGDYDSFRQPRLRPLKVMWRLSIQDTIRNMLSKFTQPVTLLMINYDRWEFSPHRKPFVWNNELSDAVYETSMALLGLPSALSPSDKQKSEEKKEVVEEEYKDGHKRKGNSSRHKFIWKTTTHARSDFESAHNSAPLDARDSYMCSKGYVKCFNISWTTRLSNDAYADHIHFKEVISDMINLQFLYDILLPSE